MAARTLSRKANRPGPATARVKLPNFQGGLLPSLTGTGIRFGCLTSPTGTNRYHWRDIFLARQRGPVARARTPPEGLAGCRPSSRRDSGWVMFWPASGGGSAQHRMTASPARPASPYGARNAVAQKEASPSQASCGRASLRDANSWTGHRDGIPVGETLGRERHSCASPDGQPIRTALA